MLVGYADVFQVGSDHFSSGFNTVAGPDSVVRLLRSEIRLHELDNVLAKPKDILLPML